MTSPSDTPAAPDVGEPFDWKAAWYALDRDNAALSTRAQAAEAEKEAMRVERDGAKAQLEVAVKLLTRIAQRPHDDGPDISMRSAVRAFLASLSLKERKDE